MNRSTLAALALAVATSATPGLAQSPRQLPLQPGDPFPELEVFDDEGNPFNTKSLQGQHAVVVNGCLT